MVTQMMQQDGAVQIVHPDIMQAGGRCTVDILIEMREDVMTQMQAQVAVGEMGPVDWDMFAMAQKGEEKGLVDWDPYAMAQKGEVAQCDHKERPPVTGLENARQL